MQPHGPQVSDGKRWTLMRVLVEERRLYYLYTLLQDFTGSAGGGEKIFILLQVISRFYDLGEIDLFLGV